MRSAGRILASLAFAAVLAGCAADRFYDADNPSKPPYLIPADAQRVAEGPPPLSYIPGEDDSTVYILDNSTASLITTSKAEGGDMFYLIDPTEKAVIVKSPTDPTKRAVLAAPIDPSHRFSIWVTKGSPTTNP